MSTLNETFVFPSPEDVASTSTLASCPDPLAGFKFHLNEATAKPHAVKTKKPRRRRNYASRWISDEDFEEPAHRRDYVDEEDLLLERRRSHYDYRDHIEPLCYRDHYEFEEYLQSKSCHRRASSFLDFDESECESDASYAKTKSVHSSKTGSIDSDASLSPFTVSSSSSSSSSPSSSSHLAPPSRPSDEEEQRTVDEVPALSPGTPVHKPNLKAAKPARCIRAAPRPQRPEGMFDMAAIEEAAAAYDFSTPPPPQPHLIPYAEIETVSDKYTKIPFPNPEFPKQLPPGEHDPFEGVWCSKWKSNARTSAYQLQVRKVRRCYLQDATALSRGEDIWDGIWSYPRDYRELIQDLRELF